jgi:hypothetical protein
MSAEGHCPKDELSEEPAVCSSLRQRIPLQMRLRRSLAATGRLRRVHSLPAFREFFAAHFLVMTLVASDSQDGFSMRATISTAAKYFGAFAAGLPKGANNLAITSAGISCSLKPSRSAVSVVFNLAGSRLQLRIAAASDLPK